MTLSIMDASLTPERAQQIRTLFGTVVALDPDDRAAALDQACLDDADLRREVEELLKAHDQADDVLHKLDHTITDIPDRLLGQTLSRYQIQEKLGGGGMGVVYQALDTKLDRTVALKFLPPHLGFDEDSKLRFIHEAKAASALDHANICTIHDIDEVEAGQLFIAMAFYTGETLKKKIARGPLPLDEALDYTAQMAEGLSRAHEAGIVHRDIKPANVMVTDRDRVKIVDFGLAKVQDVSLTQTGTTLGTVAYMSPEQARGEAVDHRTDLWSLGVVLYELLTGERPFRGEYAQAILYGIRHDEPEPVRTLRSEVPEALGVMVQKLLKKDPDERYQQAEAVLADLRSLQRTLEAAAPEAEPVSPQPPHRSRLLHYGGMAVLMLVLAGLGLREWLRSSASSERTATAEAARATPLVAVLPLANFSGDEKQEYFADGMTDELITTLNKIEALPAIGHRSVMRFKNSDQPITEIARLLGVTHVIDGSVLPAEDSVRITINLYTATSDVPLWGERFTRGTRDVMTLQREVALAVAEEIEVTLTPQDRARLADTLAVDPIAFDLYVKGTQARYKFTPEALLEAVDHFEQAITADSGYAPAYAGLAAAHFFSRDEHRAQDLVEKALELDPNLAEAHVVLGLIRQQVYGDWAGAEEAFRRALRLNPGHAEAHHELSMLLMRLKRFDEALSEAQYTLYLNPLSVRFQHGVVEIYLFSSRYDEAIEAAEKALALDPSYGGTYWSLGMAYGQQGRYEQAVQTLEQGLELGWDVCRVDLGYVYAVSGRREEAIEILDAFKEQWRNGEEQVGYGIARIYAGLGERVQALEWLEQIVETSWGSTYLGIDPVFRPLHTEPRFQALLEKTGLD